MADTGFKCNGAVKEWQVQNQRTLDITAFLAANLGQHSIESKQVEVEKETHRSPSSSLNLFEN